MIRTSERRMIGLTRNQQLIYRSFVIADNLDLSDRARKRLVRYGIEECRAGRSLAMALAKVEEMARNCFWSDHE